MLEDVKAVTDFFPSNNSFYNIHALEKIPLWKNECVEKCWIINTRFICPQNLKFSVVTF